MTILEAIILGIIQGLTEFLPVSSSGHLELGKAIMGIEIKNDISFTLIVHLATTISTMVILRKKIVELLTTILKSKQSKQYILYIILSMLPAVLVGLLFKDQIELLFDNNILLVGSMLLLTGILLITTQRIQGTQTNGKVSFKTAIAMGIMQAIAILPGISRSGSTIATGLLFKGNKSEIATFSFLMVIPVIIGASAYDLLKMMRADAAVVTNSVEPLTLLAGFIAALLSGLLACKWMLNIVEKGQLTYFGIYCFLVGIAAIIFHFFM